MVMTLDFVTKSQPTGPLRAPNSKKTVVHAFFSWHRFLQIKTYHVIL